MIKFLFLTIPSQCSYESLKSPIKFKQDIYGVTTWTMKHPLTIYPCDLKYKHVFRRDEVKIQPVSNVSLQQKWKYFVITKGDGGKYYCTSQIVYVVKRPVEGIIVSFIVPVSPSLFRVLQCILYPVVLSTQMHRNDIVTSLFQTTKLKKKQPAISYCIQQDLYEMYLQYLETGRQKQWQHVNLLSINSKRKIHCPLKLSFSYYVESCDNHSMGECIYIEKTSNRQVLHLYKLHHSTLYQIGYFFHLPFSSLTLRKIISAILTQKQIIFSSINSNLTVMVIQTLMQMILPLKWCYMYAPNLPVQLVQAAQESFMPFIVGVSKQYLPLIANNNKIIVHIDTDQIQINYDQEEEELNMLSKRFQRFLTWKANSNKQYLQWQKQLRINSILMITTIFRKDITAQIQGEAVKGYESSQQKLSQERFYDQFLSKSMMYRKLIQDVHENVYSQFYKLIKLDYSERKAFLQNKFNSLHSQTIYPNKCDNKKKWIKFYQKYMRQRRRTRLNRHSLSMVENNLIGLNSNNHGQNFYVSNVSLSGIGNINKVQGMNSNRSQLGSNIISQTNRFHFMGNNLRDNQLYQSTISTHSVNTQSSLLKFNVNLNGHGNQGKTIYPAQQQQQQKKQQERIITYQHPQQPQQQQERNAYQYPEKPKQQLERSTYQPPRQHQQQRERNITYQHPQQQNSFSKANNNLFGSSSTNLSNAGSSYQSMICRNEYVGVNNIANIQPNSKPNSQQINMSAHKTPPQNNIILNSNHSNQTNPLNNINVNQQISPFNPLANNHPLNQSMVSSLISTNPNNINTYQAMGQLNNISSLRKLSGTQSTVVL